MSNLQIENNNKEEEILALEEKLTVALVRIEKTIEINREVSNHLWEKSLQLEEAATTINEQKNNSRKRKNHWLFWTLYDESKTVAKSLQKQLYEMQDVRDDRDLSKSQYEKLTQDFENKVTPLQE